MDRKKLLFLINPHAGKSEIKNRALEIIDLFVRSGYEVTVHTTQEQTEITTLVPERAGAYDLLVCCGGDGTLNETVAGLMRCERRPLLGYIPAGTVNDFASSLRLSKNMMQAARTIVTGVPFLCDTGSFNDRYFTYIAAFGAFTEVSYQTTQQSKNLLGRAAYILEGIKRLPAIKAYRIRAAHDRGEIEGEFLFGMVTNATSVGGFKIGERLAVSMNDGLLEGLFVRAPRTVLEAQQLINAILARDFSSDYIAAFRTTHLLVEAEEELPWTLDGEYGGSPKTAEIANQPHAIRVLVDPALDGSGEGTGELGEPEPRRARVR